MASRAAVISEVAARLTRLLTNAGMTAADEPGNMKEPADDALRMLGYAEEALPAPDPEPEILGWLALLEYTTLRRIVRAIGDRFDLTTGGRSLRLSQQIKTARDLLKDAETEVIRIYGMIPTGINPDDLTDGGVIYWDSGLLTDGTTGDEFARYRIGDYG